jgi:hypothetical protein
MNDDNNTFFLRVFLNANKIYIVILFYHHVFKAKTLLFLKHKA